MLLLLVLPLVQLFAMSLYFRMGTLDIIACCDVAVVDVAGVAMLEKLLKILLLFVLALMG